MSNTDERLVRETPQPEAPAAGAGRGLRTPGRGPAYGLRFAIATDHPTASLAGMNVLQGGGNAVDACIATAAVNVVVKPYATHLGGDAFALVWHRSSGAVECLNAGGRAPHTATLEEYEGGVPQRGPRASTLPGLVDAWCELHGRHGSRPLAELLRPAIELAERGFPASMHLARATEMLATIPQGEANEAAREAFLSEGRPYRKGELFCQPQLAETLGRIAGDGRAGFYEGATGRAIAQAMAAGGGLIDSEDLAQPQAHWHDPLTTSYAGCTVYEQALPSQGMVLLEALNIVEQFPLRDWGPASPEAVHIMVEATRLALADARRHAADPLFESVPTDRLLSKAHARARAAEIDLTRAGAAPPAVVPSDTTSFVVADEETAVCFIQSVYWPWGSAFVVPGTAALMNNRMLCFDADAASPNRLAPGKRAVHTLNNFLVLRDGQLVVGGGTPGGDRQVQTNLQTVVGALDWGLDLQRAIDAPRWAIGGDGGLILESRFPDATFDGLRERGHAVQRTGAWDGSLSRSQVVASRAEGGWAAASDLRGEGTALAI